MYMEFADCNPKRTIQEIASASREPPTYKRKTEEEEKENIEKENLKKEVWVKKSKSEEQGE